MAVDDHEHGPSRPHVSLREYVEALNTAEQRATEMAEREREKAAQALGAERRQATATAEREREKAAQVQAAKFGAQIVQGDEALKDHIRQQIAQLEIMLESLRRETMLQFDAFQKAVDKSETSFEHRFHALNGLREQMGELISAHRAQTLELTSTLMPREVVEAKLEEMGQKIDVNTSRLDKLRGRDDGEQGGRQRSQASVATLISAVVAAVVVISAVVAVANAVSG